MVEGKDKLKGSGIAIDGKTMRGSYNGSQKAIHLLSGVVVKSKIFSRSDSAESWGMNGNALTFLD